MPFLDSVGQGKVMAGTGHRLETLEGREDRVRGVIRERLTRYLPSLVLCGMATGFDLWFGDEALNLGIRVNACVPYIPGPARRDDPLYDRIIRNAQTVTILQVRTPASHGQAARWLHERNTYMATHADFTLACWDGDSHGGTAHMVRLSRSLGAPVDTFDPFEI